MGISYAAFSLLPPVGVHQPRDMSEEQTDLLQSQHVYPILLLKINLTTHYRPKQKRKPTTPPKTL